MLLGYNTNGFAHHRFEDCLAVLAEIGYQSVAITLDHHTLNPFGPDLAAEIERARELLRRYGLRSVIETGARYLLDARRKHEPTLVSPSGSERAVRLEFLKRSVDIAAALESDAVSFWSGRMREPLMPPAPLRRLAEGCRALSEYAGPRGVRLAFEPEPGMLIERLEQFAQLMRLVDAPHFGLTMDVGHVYCVDDGDIAEQLGRWRDRLFNVHIEDMRRGVHEHLMFNEGEIDFRPVLAVLREIDYQGGAHVELSRHSHDAVETARRAYGFLRRLVAEVSETEGTAEDAKA